ncbi:MAG: flavodoxin family protein [Deltaproteobacteria bacterium]|jgi:multimeric flavodoxin WrbA|nr:flavodoxin family protein [Deltaproteobacteria bacterium]
MKFYAINGSPRKNKNTATLLQAALDGIRSTGAEGAHETEMIHLYDINYQSCLSCFQCKRLGGKCYGKCAINDDLTPLIERLSLADGIIFGSPIYYGNITGKMRSFFERLLFPFSVYDANFSSLAPRRMPTAFIYTMNVTEEMMGEWGYKQNLADIEFFIGRTFSTPKILYGWNTYQFNDYSKYKMEYFSEADKAAYRERQFPLDCKQAFQMGVEMAGA